MKAYINKFLSIVTIVALIFTTISSFTSITAYAFTASNAEIAAQDFVDVYWDSDAKYFYCNSDRAINPEHNPGPQGGLYTDYWWEAQLWETVMDIYERTEDPFYYQMIGDVFDGFLSAYPNWSENPFNDDIGWWALASLRAYDITGESRYAEIAKEMFDFVYDNQWSSDFGGGIWWNRINFLPQKNVATNGTASVIAMRLSRIYPEGNYAAKAELLFQWVKDTFYNPSTGKVSDNIKSDGLHDWEYTYNFGVFAAAAYEMYLYTQDVSYRQDAFNAIDWALNNLTLDGILIYEGEDDCPGFKMIFSRFVMEIAQAENRADYIDVFQRNATQAFNHRRTSDGIIGPDFNTIPQNDEQIQSLAAAAGVSILQLTQPDGFTGNIISGTKFEAENTRRYGIDNENLNTGFSGRGYTAGWNDQNTKLTFEYNASQAGVYMLTFRYSAAAGNAARTLVVNNTTIDSSLLFSGTPGWSDWQTIAIPIPLQLGINDVELSFNQGNYNYLNLDYIDVTLSENAIVCEAENGTLHNLSTENTHTGYSGTGYVAGWNSDGQYVDVKPTIEQSGVYDITIRYSVGNGNASRLLFVNGNNFVNNLSFSGGNNWGDYRTITVHDVPLVEGENTISLIYNGSLGSTNWLNYDSLTITN